MVSNLSVVRTSRDEQTEEVVEVLEGALRRARDGEFSGIVIGAVLPDGDGWVNYCGGPTAALIGMSDTVKHAILRDRLGD